MGFGMGFCCCGPSWCFCHVNICCTNACRWQVDLGAGGWVDSACGDCDLVSGVFIAEGQVLLDHCYKVYSASTSCDSGLGSLEIKVGTPIGFGPNCQIEVFIALKDRSGTDKSAAIYLLAPFHTGGGNCDQVYTLSKFSESHVGGYCTGALPATITVQAA